MGGKLEYSTVCRPFIRINLQVKKYGNQLQNGYNHQS
jgi:hypothetical protein